MRANSSISTVRRVIAVTLTIIFAMTFITPAASAETGGDFGACENGLWLKADWDKTAQDWKWQTGPDWDGDAPTPPVLKITSMDGSDPMTVDWTSGAYVLKATVKASTELEDFSGGYSGTVTGIDEHAISFIVFCFGPEPPTGSLTVVKEVVGDYEGDAFAFAGTCQLPQFPAHATFSLADGESWTFPERVPGYLDGSPCEFTETDTNGADSVAYHLGETELVPGPDGKVAFTLSSTEDLVLTVTNTFEPERPEVVLEKVWFADADDSVPTAILRQSEGGWTLVEDGPEGYEPPADFVQPEGFDATVTYGEETYTVAETLPEGWQNITCPADAPQPNGLGSFPYERPDDVDGDRVSAQVDGPRDSILHLICNAPLPEQPEPDVPSIGLTKTPEPGLVEYVPGGDDEIVTYTYVITNTGETPLSGITLVDDVLGTITLTDTDLAVGESMKVEATHVVTEADATAGEIVNEAEATGTAPDTTKVSDTATATVLVETQAVQPEVEERSEITLTKTALVTPDQDGRKVVTWRESAPTATEITYEYVITNTGETPLSGITLVDDVLGTITLTDTDLAVGESTTVTAVHTVTEADADAGAVTNVAVTTGTAPDGTEVGATAEETVLVAEVQAEKEEQLPVTGAASAVLGILAAASMATGAGLLRLSTRRR